MNIIAYLRAQDEPSLRNATLDLHLNVGAKMPYLQDIVCYADSTRTSGGRLRFATPLLETGARALRSADGSTPSYPGIYVKKEDRM